MRALWIAATLTAALGGSAVAGPLADALAKQDIPVLRTQLSDPAARCTLGAVFAKKQDLARAALYLDKCSDLTLPDDVSADIARAVRETRKKLQTTELSSLEIVTRPEGTPVELDSMPGEQIAGGTLVWVKAGTRVVSATVNGKKFANTVEVKPYARGAVILDASSAFAPPPKVKDGHVSFEEDNALEKHDGQPKDVKRGSMVSNKLLGVVEPSGGEVLADPMAGPPPPEPLPLWIGVRLGGGMFDDAATTSRVRPSVAATARYVLGGPAFLSARIDWSRRGGAADTSVDVLGASAGAGYSVVDANAIGIALIGQLRGDLRIADTRNAMSVSRAGASAAAGLEVAFPSTPLTAGVRFEQGLTELVPGARDRALLVELGVDWR